MKAFTLVELMVSTAIILVISGVLFSNQQEFGRTMLLKNTAYDIALSLRNAQTYGIGSRGVSAVTKNAGYGIEFSSTKQDSFVFFADTSPTIAAKAISSGIPATPVSKPGDGVYTVGSDTLVQTYQINNSMKITNFCGIATPKYYCATGGNQGSMGRLDVVFTRPNPFASTTLFNSSGTKINDINISGACLTITAPVQNKSHILVRQNGSVTATSSCP
jgi:prepilin-type N-terminal cleavage/methylation domain-containing protein